MSLLSFRRSLCGDAEPEHAGDAMDPRYGVSFLVKKLSHTLPDRALCLPTFSLFSDS